jgi:hypothetical protein
MRASFCQARSLLCRFEGAAVWCSGIPRIPAVGPDYVNLYTHYLKI